MSLKAVTPSDGSGPLSRAALPCWLWNALDASEPLSLDGSWSPSLDGSSLPPGRSPLMLPRGRSPMPHGSAP